MGPAPWLYLLVCSDSDQTALMCQRPGEGARKHCHVTHREWWVVLEGEFEWQFGDGKNVKAKAGSVVICPPGLPHRIVCISKAPGIRRATAQLLRQEGFIVYGLARHIETGKFNRRCDVARESSVRKIFSALEKEAGRIDVLVNSAGIAHQADPLAIKTGDWEKVFAVNVTGTFLCCRQALAGMKRRGYGRIINLGSVAARSYSRSASAAYTSSKYAVVGLTRHLAAAFGAYGVTINCVCPSQTNTEMLRKALSKAEIKAESRGQMAG